MKDTIPKTLKNGRYIINLNSSGESGSHWVCMIKQTQSVYYFDPYGVYPVQNLVDLCLKRKLKLYYNMTQIQHVDSILCGWFCIAFLHFMETAKGDMIEKCFDFDDLFNSNTKKNDVILKKYINKIY